MGFAALNPSYVLDDTTRTPETLTWNGPANGLGRHKSVACVQPPRKTGPSGGRQSPQSGVTATVAPAIHERSRFGPTGRLALRPPDEGAECISTSSSLPSC